MTNTEAKSYSKELALIWGPLRPQRRWRLYTNKNGEFTLRALVPHEKVRLQLVLSNGTRVVTLKRGRHWLRYSDALDGGWSYSQENSELFLVEIMPFMRRACFLSGCKLEASQEERVSWARFVVGAGMSVGQSRSGRLFIENKPYPSISSSRSVGSGGYEALGVQL